MKIAEDTLLYRKRRERLARAMQAGIAVIPTAPERVRNRDSHYPYRFDSHFYYLTGFAEPGAALVIVAGEAPRSLLFCRTRSEEREIWDGFRYGPEAARERFGFDAAHPIEALDEALASLLENQPALYYPVGDDPEWDARAMKWLNAVRARVRAGVAAPDRVQDVRALVDDMRVVKEEQFGPVIPIVKYKTVDEAIGRANALDVGLGGSVWGNDPQEAARFASRLECGTAWVNQHGTLHPMAPFGGVKCSGIGVEFNIDGLKEYTTVQVVNVAL